MHYFTFAEKDTTLYQGTGSLNAGLDEVLEIQKSVSDSGDNINTSRVLIKFDLTEISASIVNGTISNPSFYLNLYDAKSSNLSISQSLYAYPVSQSWIMGQGHYHNNPITDEGASWNFRDGATDGTLWGEVSSSGGTWIDGNGYAASHSIGHKTIDIRMDVTDIVNQWITGSISNEGFLLKRSGSNALSGSDEGSTTRFGNLSFFSSDTHTKYPPTLETVWNDSKWSTGSLSALTQANIEDMSIYMKGLRPEYKEKSKARFRLVGRERFPEATYDTTPANLSVKYLPSGSSFYSILDAETDEVLVPYGSGSIISCDSTGNYFNLWLDGYQPERYYRLEFRIQSGSGVDELDQYFNEGFTFKVSQ
tara:strand:+ start:62 stop:1153 length:1092 start_codon:yes stop_codon:yes gene_type:complete